MRRGYGPTRLRADGGVAGAGQQTSSAIECSFVFFSTKPFPARGRNFIPTGAFPPQSQQRKQTACRFSRHGTSASPFLSVPMVRYHFPSTSTFQCSIAMYRTIASLLLASCTHVRLRRFLVLGVATCGTAKRHADLSSSTYRCSRHGAPRRILLRPSVGLWIASCRIGAGHGIGAKAIKAAQVIGSARSVGSVEPSGRRHLWNPGGA